MQKPKNPKFQAGFSLVELMVVISLVGILSVAISSMVLTTIAQVTRVRTQIKIRQSGDYALGQMQTMLRNSRQIINCDSTTSEITLLNPDGNTTTFVEQDLGSYTAIASNSGELLTSPEVTTGSSLRIECLPDDLEPRLIKISFDLTKAIPSERARENASIHYETSVELRN